MNFALISWSILWIMTCSYFVYKFLRKHFKMDKWKVYFNTLWHFVTKLSTIFLYQFKIHYKICSHSFLLHLGIVQFSAKAPPLSHLTAAHPWSSTFHTDQWLQLYSTWAGLEILATQRIHTCALSFCLKMLSKWVWQDRQLPLTMNEIIGNMWQSVCHLSVLMD